MQRSSANLSSPAVSHTMLVVEDEEPCRRALKMLLRSQGFTVHAVASAEEALERLRLEPDPPDFMVVDVDLPGMGGLDLVAQVHVTMPAIHSVLVTAADQTMVERFVAEHEVDYFPKPLNIDSFLRRIRQIQ